MHQNDSLLSSLDILYTFSSIPIVAFEQVIFICDHRKVFKVYLAILQQY